MRKFTLKTYLGAAAVFAAALIALLPVRAAGPGSNVPPGIVSLATNVPTYRAAIHNFSQSSTGDLFCISGSTTGKVVKVKWIDVSAINSAAVVSSVSVQRRSTLDTGTPTTMTAVPNDPLNDAATAVTQAFATAPTPGTLVGIIAATKMAIPTATTTTFPNRPAMFDFARLSDQPIVLRKSTDAACVDVDSTAGGVWEADVEWTEEP